MLAIVTFGTTARVAQPLRRMADDAKVTVHYIDVKNVQKYFKNIKSVKNVTKM